MIFVSIVLAVLTNAADLSSALQKRLVDTEFDLTATVMSECRTGDRDFSLEDGTGAVIVSPPRDMTNISLCVGTKIRVLGQISLTKHKHVFADCKSISRLGSSVPAPPHPATFEQILSGQFDAQLVKTSGLLRDYFTDEVDPEFTFLIFNQGRETLYAALNRPDENDMRRIDSLVGQRLEVIGLCDSRPSGCRRRIGRIIRIQGLTSLRTSSATSVTTSKFPLIDNIDRIQASDLPKLGRCRALGRVIAVWQGTSLLIRTPANTLVRVNLAKNNPPRVGDCIEAVGFPETDLYRINFSRAIWRLTTRNAVLSREPATNVLAAAIIIDRNGKPAFSADFHGRTVRLRGMVRSLPSIGNDGRFYLESDGYTFPIDISANPSLVEKLEIGSIVDVTGVCVMDIENWRPNLVFPHIKEVMIVTRTPSDIVVIKRPPWWTPGRLAAVIGSLLAILSAVLVWNRSLRALAEKRGKALAGEEIGRLEADLKAAERTRLSAELHDSIAQNLSGVSMELDTALNGDENLPPGATQHLSRASKTLDSCRVELRNCIWDLRSRALDEPDMDRAIRVALSPTVGKARLLVRFDVPRSSFDENTARTILNIVRELASNAIRHGHADEIRVAGSLDGDTLRFSVSDDGTGFDPENCPGVMEGHFGLQGIEERVNFFNGEMRIVSSPGKGTQVSIAIEIKGLHMS